VSKKLVESRKSTRPSPDDHPTVGRGAPPARAVSMLHGMTIRDSRRGVDQQVSVAVILPCHNEEAALPRVIAESRVALPGCLLVVADNASSDSTATVASSLGAFVLSEPRLGKGYAVRRLFSAVEADIYVLLDGDGTYDISTAPEMIRLLDESCLDMVVGVRQDSRGPGEGPRRGHRVGNLFLTWIFRTLFRLNISDSLSGYRVMSRRFVKTFPSASVGFEVETDINVHAAVLGSPIAEVSAPYVSRPEGSASKLRTYRDGWRILRRNLRLFKDGRPALAFLLMGAPWFLLSAGLMTYVFDYYFRTGTVRNFPSLIAGVGAFLVFLNLWISGVVLERISRNRDEVARLAYLSFPGRVLALGRPEDMPSATELGPRQATDWL
jgi:glycosyltransferase involved in cell wall biosynthesis